MSSFKGIAISVLLEGTHASDEVKRYRLDWDTATRVGRLVIFGKTEIPEELVGALGLVDIQTSETHIDQGATLVLKVGRLGRRLVDLVECQDRLRVEIRAADEQTLSVAFDGFIEMPTWTEASTPGAVSNSLSLKARGVVKIFNQQWLNWQGMLRASDSKDLFGPGSTIYEKLLAEGQSAAPTDLIKILVQYGADKIIDLKSGDTAVKSGEFFQIAEGTDWATAFDLRQANSRNWYLNSGGSFWGIMAGLAEMDFHEFFWTYSIKNGGGQDAKEIPTLVFRPRPFPGAQGDDAGWNALDVYVVGDPGDGTGCRHLSSSKVASNVSNAFTLGSASAGMGQAGDIAAKIRLPFWSDHASIKRFGFGVRAVTTSLIGTDGASFWGKTGQKILERIAYQDAPLPYLPNQTRSYPLLAGIHVGAVLEDHTVGREVCGYIVSVTHKITYTNNAVSIGTILGLSRCIPKVTSEEYPDAVRALVDIQRDSYIEPDPMKVGIKESGVSGGQSQPAINDTTAVQVLTKSTRADKDGIMNVANSTQKAAIIRLQKVAVDPVKAAVGPITITSGFRNALLNKAVGSSGASQHLDGNAFDFQPVNGTARGAWETLKATGGIPYKQLILETRSDGTQWVHVGVYPDGQSGPAEFFELHPPKGGAST